MERRYIFPGILFLCNIGAAAVALWERDWRDAVYYIASGACIAVFSFRD